MNVTEMSPIGARVADVRVDALGDDAVTEVRRLLAEHGVLVFTEQDADNEAFLAFLRSFGRTVFTVGETPVPGFPDLNVISNVGRTTPPKSTFHVDTSYVAHPPVYTSLRAVTVPAEGGQTLFTDQYRAYDTLDPELREKLDGRTVTHVVTGVDPGDDQETSAEHPLFAVHPISGRTSIYLSTPQRCVAVSGMTAEESAEVVLELFEHCTAEENTLRHRWSPGDVVIWDNRVVMHKADHSGVVGDRVMHRGMVA